MTSSARAIILAAGLGRRMWPLTRSTHKTLLPIAGEPLLVRMVGTLLAAGIDDITVVTGYRAQDLHQTLGQAFPRQTFRWVHNERYESTNNIFSLALAFSSLPDDLRDILLLEGDLVFEPAVLGELLACPHANAALLDRYVPGMDGTVVSVASDGHITGIHPPHMQDVGFDFSDKYKTLNIYRFSADFYRSSLKQQIEYYARSVDDNCYYELILGIVIYLQKARIQGVFLEGEVWAEVDDPIDLTVAEFQFDPPGRLKLLSESHGGYWKYDLIDHCYLRNMYFPPHSLLADVRNTLPDLLGSYGSAQHVVDRHMAQLLDMPEQLVVTLNGAAQLYPWLARYLAGRRVFIPQPTFGEYGRVFGTEHTYSDDFAVDIDALAARLAPGDVVVVVNPNNPTGTTLGTGGLRRLATGHPDQLFVFDESFLAFTEHTSLLRRDLPTNVLVVKSYSKSLGVPGLRLGVASAGDAALIADLRASLPIWNLNSVAEYFLEMLFKYRMELTTSFESTRRDRALFEEQLARLPDAQVFPGGGNFVVVKLDPSRWPDDLAQRLIERHKVYVKDVTDRIPRDGLWYRLAVRTPGDNARLVELLHGLHLEMTHV